MAAFAVVVFVGLLSVAVYAQQDQGDIMRNCISKSKLPEDKAKELSDTFMDLKDVSNMENDTKEVYHCVLHTMGLIDDKYCVKWDKVCDWYASELPESIRETYMKKHKTDIVACDTGCKSGDNAKDMREMLTSTKCVFNFMRDLPKQIKELK